MSRKYFQSAYLQVLEKIFRLPLSLLLSVLTANFLGAQQFGALTVAHTVVLFALPVANFGIDTLIYSRFYEDKHHADRLLVNAIFAKFIAFIFSYICLLVYCIVFMKTDTDSDVSMIMTIGAILLFSCFTPVGVLQTVFGFGKSKVAVSGLAFIISALFRLYLIFSNAELYWFAVALIIESLFSALLLFYWSRLFRHKLSINKIDRGIIKKIFVDSLPLFISLFLISVFTKTDILLIDYYLTRSDVANFAVALKMIEVIAIFPTVVISSLFPLALAAKQNGESEFRTKLEYVLSIGYILGIFILIGIGVFGGKFINFVYSEEFSASAGILKILCWAAIFQFFGSFSTLWLVSEGLQRYRVYRIAAAVLLNIVLNIILIPDYGIVGAAYATLVSQFVASILGNSFTANTREIFWIQCRILACSFIFTSIRRLRRNK